MAKGKINKNASAQVSVTGKSVKAEKAFTVAGFAVLLVVLVISVFLCNAKYPFGKDESGVIVSVDA